MAHGFVRDAGGGIQAVYVPGALHTGPRSINTDGAVTGSYLDASGEHGFVSAALPSPTNKDQCMNGGWQARLRPDGTPFTNQGDCIQYVNTGN